MCIRKIEREIKTKDIYIYIFFLSSENFIRNKEGYKTGRNEIFPEIKHKKGKPYEIHLKNKPI